MNAAPVTTAPAPAPDSRRPGRSHRTPSYVYHRTRQLLFERWLFVLAGATPAAIGLLADVTEAYPDDRGAIMGLYSVFLGLGQIAGALVAGLMASILGLDGIFAASIVLLVVAVVPLISLRRFEHYLGGPETPAELD